MISRKIQRPLLFILASWKLAQVRRENTGFCRLWDDGRCFRRREIWTHRASSWTSAEEFATYYGEFTQG